MKKVLGILPLRSGSKGIPGKNTVKFMDELPNGLEKHYSTQNKLMMLSALRMTQK